VSNPEGRDEAVKPSEKTGSAQAIDNGDSVPQQIPDLHDLIDEKIEALIEDAHAGGWTTDDALMAIEQVVARRWLRRRDAALGYAARVDEDFVSDGNEG
jgi:hypothetical protein